LAEQSGGGGRAHTNRGGNAMTQNERKTLKEIEWSLYRLAGFLQSQAESPIVLRDELHERANALVRHAHTLGALIHAK
jgi:hypothetical protein